MRILMPPLTLVLALIAAGCGGGGDGGATTSAAAAQNPTPSSRSQTDGFASGELTSVTGRTIIVQGQNVLTRVALTDVTRIVMQVGGARVDLVKGACLVASGTRNGVGIAAEVVRVRVAGNGGCSADAGPEDADAGPEDAPANDAEPAEEGPSQAPEGSRNRAFAVGTISAVTGTTLRLDGTEGAATVVVSASTQIRKLRRVRAAAVTTGLCAVVRGRADQTGAITAATITLSRPGSSGCGLGPGDGDFGGDSGAETNTHAGG